MQTQSRMAKSVKNKVSRWGDVPNMEPAPKGAPFEMEHPQHTATSGTQLPSGALFSLFFGEGLPFKVNQPKKAEGNPIHP